MKETRVQSLGQEDPLEEGMATHSSVLAWRSPRTEEPGGLQSVGSQRLGRALATEYTQSNAHPRPQVTDDPPLSLSSDLSSEEGSSRRMGPLKDAS